MLARRPSPVLLALAGFAFSLLTGCSGGAVGSSSGTSGTSQAKTESQTIAEELFKTPDADFDESAIEGLYLVQGLTVSPVRVRIAADSISVGHKTSSGALVGLTTGTQMKSTGTNRWSVLVLDPVRADSGACVDQNSQVTLSLLSTTFTLTSTKPGTLSGNLPMSVATQTCSSTGGTGNNAGTAIGDEGTTFTKIGK